MRSGKYEMVNNYDGTWSIRVYDTNRKVWFYMQAIGHGMCRGAYSKDKKQAKRFEYGKAVEVLKDLTAHNLHTVKKVTVVMD